MLIAPEDCDESEFADELLVQTLSWNLASNFDEMAVTGILQESRVRFDDPPPVAPARHGAHPPPPAPEVLEDEQVCDFADDLLEAVPAGIAEVIPQMI